MNPLWKNPWLRGCIFLLAILGLIGRLAPQFLYPFGDPDYFWHFKAGEYIYENRTVPERDIFSFSVPEFRWVNHEWASDTALYFLETRFGVASVSGWYILIFLATVACATFGWKNNLNMVDMILGVIGAITLFAYSGVREQMYSFLFFALLLRLLLSRLAWVLPVLFLLWANMHGGFTLGIFVVASVGVYYWYNFFKYGVDRDLAFRYSFLTIAIILSTLVNPYGWRIYEEITRTVSDTNLQSSISEWVPIIFSPVNLTRYAVFLSLVLALSLDGILKNRSPRSIYLLALLFAPFWSAKYAPYFVISFLPVLLTYTEDLLTQERIEGYRALFHRKFTYVIFLVGFVVAVLFIKPEMLLKGGYPAYPSNEALSALSSVEHKNVFNEYGWGGYLIRYAPEKKVFMDGRMPSWGGIFGEYLSVVQCKKIDEVFSKYDIRAIIWPKKVEGVRFRLNAGYLEKINQYFAGASSENIDKCDFISELLARRWVVVYDDGNAVILER